MATPTIADYLKYANLQMAAEALYAFDAIDNGPNLIPGEISPAGSLTISNLTKGNRHASKMTATEVEISGLITDWEVKQHISNTTTGFSGTLFFNSSKNEYVMSFRSTEFIDDAARDNEATNSLEIKEKGWAFGQLDDMEQWYQSIERQIAGPLTVTGYSLGGHLATAFNLMHQGAAAQVINFNGAGVGTIEDGSLSTTTLKLPQMIHRFHKLREQAKTGIALDNLMTSGLGKQTYSELRTHWLGNLSGIPDSSLIDLLKSKMNLAVFGTEVPNPAVKADYYLLKEALDRVMYVTNYAHWAPTLASGATGEGDPTNPANIPDWVNGNSAIAAESMDYQLAVLATAKEYRTTALSYWGGVQGALGAPAPAQGKSSITNQFDLAATEIGDLPALSMVSHSQYRYGKEFNLFIEDQPQYRGNVNWAVIKASLHAPDIEVRLLVPEYAKNDFGDTHSLVLILDSLNVQNTFSKLVPEDQQENTTSLLKSILVQASNLKAKSALGGQGKAEGDVLENIVNGLADTFGLNWKDAQRLNGNPTGGTWAEITDKVVGPNTYAGRTTFYDKLKLIQDNEQYKNLKGKLTITAPPSEGKNAIKDFGAFLSLKYLTPFALKGDDAAMTILKSAQSELAAKWNADKDLSPEQRAQKANFSDRYLADRTAMLSWVIKRNAENIPDGQTILTNRTTDKWQFQDITSSITIEISNTPTLSPPPEHYILFGKDNDFADTLNGGNAGDSLYGGDGNDTLNGMKGNDYIEGNAGNDTLLGGLGNDTLLGGTGTDFYEIKTDGGSDVLIDSDGLGKVTLAGIVLTSGKKMSGAEQEWESADSKVHYKKVLMPNGTADLLITVKGSDATARIQGWKVASWQGTNLGINLEDDTTAPPALKNLEQSSAGVHDLVHGSNVADYIRTGKRRDFVYGNNGNDVIETGDPDAPDGVPAHADNDIVDGGDGDDWIDGGYGNDVLLGGRIPSGTDAQAATEDDTLIGGEGNDQLNGGIGDDILIASKKTDLLTGPDDSKAGDWLLGGDGDDILTGSLARDMLNGGGGDDSIDGGSGDDIILGDANYDFRTALAGSVMNGNPTLDIAPSIGFAAEHTLADNGTDTVKIAASVSLYPSTAFTYTIDTSGSGNGGDFVFTPTVARPASQLVRVAEHGGDDVIDGGSGNDWIAGQTGDDTIKGGTGKDIIYGDDLKAMNDWDQGDDWLYGDAGDDKLYGGGGDDQLFGGDDNDLLVGDDFGQSGEDTLIGGAGRDTLSAGAGDDFLYGDDGDDSLDGEAGDDTVMGGAGNDKLQGRAGENYLDGEEGNDTLTGGSDDDILLGGLGEDQLNGGEGQDWLEGNDGNDTLDGGENDDILIGGQGTDQMDGGAGDDTYEFATGDDAGVISKVTDSAGENLIRLEDASLANLKLTGEGSNWTLRYSANDTIALNGSFEVSVGGTLYTMADLKNALEDVPDILLPPPAETEPGPPPNVIDGTAAAETVTGTAGNDRIDGKAGNDTLNGGTGSDTYTFSPGHGVDQINNNAADNADAVDTIEFGIGIEVGNVTVRRSADDLIVQTSAAGSPTDSIKVSNYFASNANNKIDRIVFNDGTVWNQAEIEQRSKPPQNQTDGADSLSGTTGDDEIDGLGGNDSISAGAGNDRLVGSNGNDLLAGQGGSDLLVGGEGNDDYVYNAGDGRDQIDNSATDNADAVDRIVLGAGITTASVVLNRSDDDLIVQTGADEANSITVKRYFASGGNQMIDQIRFADGTIWNQAIIEQQSKRFRQATQGADTLTGDAGNDLMHGLGGNDALSGAGGDDSLFGEEGNDSLKGDAGNDMLDGGEGADVMQGGTGDDVYLVDNNADVVTENAFEGSDTVNSSVSFTLAANLENLTLTVPVAGIQAITGSGNGVNNILIGNSANNTLDGLAGNDSLSGGEGNDLLLGGIGDDTLTGEDGDDTLIGGVGKDELNGGAGNDIYRFTVGDDWDVTSNVFDTEGDNVVELSGAVFGDLKLTGNGVAWTLDYSAHDRVYLYGNHAVKIGEIVYSIQQLKDEIAIAALAKPPAPALINGTAGDDTLLGSDGPDSIDGKAGSDILSGGVGNDALYGGDGDDLVQGGAADDQVLGGAGNDRLTGDAGNDGLNGGDGADTLDGGAGNDFLIGGNGNDTYFFGRMSGQDTIHNYDVVAGKTDIVQLGAGILASDVKIVRTAGVAGQTDLMLSIIGTADSLRISRYFEAGQQVEQIRFADGTVLDVNAIKAMTMLGTPDADLVFGYEINDALNGLDGKDTIYGGAGNDLIDGGAGADALYGSAAGGGAVDGNDSIKGGTGDDSLYGQRGNDILLGGDGNDVLDGDEGDDTLDGGTGDDTLAGGFFSGSDYSGNGSDTYLFGRGDGRDTIINFKWGITAPKTDVLQFGAGILASDIKITREDLIGDSLAHENYLTGDMPVMDGDLFGDDLILTIKGTSDSVRISRYFEKDGAGVDAAGHSKIEQIKFADGTVWNVDAVKAMALLGTEDSDALFGYRTGDVLNGLAGDDAIKGYDGNDSIDGGIGDDNLAGNNGNDLVKGGDGNDVIDGGEGDDVLSGEAGKDNLYGGAGNDVMSGAIGDDYLGGMTGNDMLTGETGNDWLDGGAGTDTLDGGIGNDTLAGGDGSDIYVLAQGFGQDTIISYDKSAGKTDVVQFGAGIQASNVKLVRSEEDLLLSFNGSTDSLRIARYFYEDAAGGFGVEQIKFADGTTWDINTVKALSLTGTAGNDSITGYDYNDMLSGLDGADTIRGLGGDDTLDGGAGADVLYGAEGNDLLTGGLGVDNLQGGAGNDLLNGGDDNDSFNGDEGNDTLDGGAGNDILIGGSGNDVYLFGRGSGQDTISNLDEGVGKTDLVQFGAGVLVSDVKVRRSGDDLFLAINGTTDSLKIGNYFFMDDTNAYKVEKIRFADGSAWDINAVKAMAVLGTAGDDTLTAYASSDLLNALDGNDLVNGMGGDDSIDGGAGIDQLYGDDGNDLLAGGAGDDNLKGMEGNDTLDGGVGNDWLEGGNGSDTYLFSRGSGQDKIYNYDSGTGKVDTVQLGAGIVSTDLTLARNLDDLILSIKGTTDSLLIARYFELEGTSACKLEQIKFADGSAWNFATVKSMMLATPGNDNIIGYATNDFFNGLDGNDTIRGAAGDDTLDGGAGIDQLYGDDGNDSIRGGLGADNMYGNAGNDMLAGEDGADWLDGGEGNDTIDSGAGNDTLTGGNGSDTYLFGRGAGQDIVLNSDSGAGKVDAVFLAADILISDVRVTRTIDDLVLSINGTTDTLRVSNYFSQDGVNINKVEQIKFAGGATWDVATVKALALAGSSGNDALTGYATGDALSGLDGNDTIRGAAGDDTLDGGAGIDQLYGDDGNDLIRAGLGADYVFGNAGNDMLAGDDGADGLEGGDGNDTLDGGVGNDTLTGGNGSDTYLFGRGTGQDLILNSDGGVGKTDVVQLAADILAADVKVARSIDDLVLSINGTTDTLRVSNYFSQDGASISKIEQIKISAGTIWDVATVKALALVAGSGNDALTGYATNDAINGLDGNDTIRGAAGDDTIDGGAGIDQLFGDDGNDSIRAGLGADFVYGNIGNDLLAGDDGADYVEGGDGNDTLDGGAGNDTLTGGNGSDTYLFGRGAGQDTLNNYDTGTGEADTLQLGAGITASDLTLIRNGDDLVLSIGGTADSIRLTSYFAQNGASSSKLEQIRFADATAWNFAQVSARLSATLTGTVGNDSLVGGLGNDTINGGLGADTMTGGAGNDIYVLDNLGDVVTENSGEGIDQVQSTITHTLAANVEALTLTGGSTINGTGNASDNLILGNGVNNTLDGVAGTDILQGGAGVDTLTDSAGNSLLDGGAGADIITGGSGREFIIGGVGNDTITTGNGADVIAFNRGDEQDIVNASTGKDNTLSLGKGIKYADLQFKKSNNDLILVTGTNEQITFKDWYVSVNNHSVANLQMVIEGTTDYVTGSANQMNNKKITQFDFDGLATKFDQARAATPSLTSWALSSSMLNFYLNSSDTAAIGGDLAYQYAKNGNLSNISMNPAVALLAGAAFGASQNLQATAGLQDLSPRLM